MATATLSRTKCDLKPLDNRVVVEREDSEETTAGGIVLPDAAKEKVNRGKVLSVGPGKLNDKGERVAMQVKKGDRVLFGKYGGTEFQTDDDHEWVIMKEDDILAVLD